MAIDIRSMSSMEDRGVGVRGFESHLPHQTNNPTTAFRALRAFCSPHYGTRGLRKSYTNLFSGSSFCPGGPPKNEKFPSRHARSEGLGVMLTMGNNLRMIDNLQHRLGILREEV